MAPTDEQLSRLDQSNEVRIKTSRGSKTIGTIIWIVVVDSEVFVRSVQGEAGRWYQRALVNPSVSIVAGDEEIPFQAILVEDPNEIEAVSDALRQKYRPGGSLDRMVRDEVLNTTLKLVPSD